MYGLGMVPEAQTTRPPSHPLDQRRVRRGKDHDRAADADQAPRVRPDRPGGGRVDAAALPPPRRTGV